MNVDIIAGDHQQGHAGDSPLHRLRVRGVHLGARGPASHVQAGQGVGGAQQHHPPSHQEHHPPREKNPAHVHDAIINYNEKHLCCNQ